MFKELSIDPLSGYFETLLDILYTSIWEGPLLVALLGLGLFLTFRLQAIQFTQLFYALRLALWPRADEQEGQGDISHFESLTTALAATIGIGNIAGVATAITLGGVGALFWMWCVGLVGMAIKYSEAILAVRYRELDQNNEMVGGPMYFIAKGLGWGKLASSFAIFGALAALGGGNMIQANSVADVFSSSMGVDPFVTGCVIAFLTAVTLAGGIKGIGRVTSILVPLMAALYLGGGVLILMLKWNHIPSALWEIVQAAFTGQAAVGGFAGSTLWMALRMGVSRGLCSSEAGLGTASIAAAAAKTDAPGRQALVSMTGAFLSTIVMCTVTALVISVSGVLGSMDAKGQLVTGASLTVAAFQAVLPGSGWVVTTGLIFFAFSTILGWGYYGEKCVEYLFHERSIPVYRLLFCLAIIPGAALDLGLVWKIADVTNALMAIPNLIGVAALSSVVVEEAHRFKLMVDSTCTLK